MISASAQIFRLIRSKYNYSPLSICVYYFFLQNVFTLGKLHTYGHTHIRQMDCINLLIKNIFRVTNLVNNN